MFNIPEWDAVHSRGDRRWQGGEKGGREERERERELFHSDHFIKAIIGSVPLPTINKEWKKLCRRLYGYQRGTLGHLRGTSKTAQHNFMSQCGLSWIVGRRSRASV